MTPRRAAASTLRVRRLGALGGPLLILVLALGGTMAGCSSGHDGAMTGSSAPASAASAAPGAAMVTVPMGSMHMPTAQDVSAAWKARPDYVTALPSEGQGAYAFALARPDVLQWLPCYCGCAAMGHRSNLDCFFQRREVQGTYQYEEHASFCDICVKTANLASQMLQQGSTMTQIRAAVDNTFSGSAPGTDTPLPPSS